MNLASKKGTHHTLFSKFLVSIQTEYADYGSDQHFRDGIDVIVNHINDHAVIIFLSKLESLLTSFNSS